MNCYRPPRARGSPPSRSPEILASTTPFSCAHSLPRGRRDPPHSSPPHSVGRRGRFGSQLTPRTSPLTLQWDGSTDHALQCPRAHTSVRQAGRLEEASTFSGRIVWRVAYTLFRVSFFLGVSHTYTLSISCSVKNLTLYCLSFSLFFSSLPRTELSNQNCCAHIDYTKPCNTCRVFCRTVYWPIRLYFVPLPSVTRWRSRSTSCAAIPTRLPHPPTLR
ncbi:hypothetical protein K438DRAFT_486348 [Mycena galopus ATCC 62051]|nr:hypothetical protein K438DRAFT_486348 [Mycena galopus ATCC 62051]